MNKITNFNLKIRSTLVVFLLAIFIFASLPLNVLAESEDQDTVTTNNDTSKDVDMDDDSNTNYNSPKRTLLSERRETKLEEAKLKVCQSRQNALGNVMNRVANRSRERLIFLDKVVERVQGYYTNNGLTIENYNELEADITKARSAVQNAIELENTLAADFSCDSDDPKGQVEQFRKQVKVEIKAMKDYRESIKAMIQAIKAIKEDGEKS